MSDVAAGRSPAEFNLFDPEVAACPFPFYDALRAAEGVYEVPGFGMYLISRYAEVVEALRTPEVFSSDFSRAGRAASSGCSRRRRPTRSRRSSDTATHRPRRC